MANVFETSRGTRATVRFSAIMAAVLLLNSGCTTGRSASSSDKPSVAVKELVKSSRSWDGELLPAYPQGQPEVTIRRIVIPPGASLDMHKHPVINAGVLLSGRLTVITAAGKTLDLKAGDPNIEVVNTLHYGINRGDVPAEIIVVYAGTVGTPITSVEKP